MKRKIIYLFIFLATAFLIRLHTLGGNSQKMTFKMSPQSELKECQSELNCYKGSVEMNSNQLEEIKKELSKIKNNAIIKTTPNYLYYTHTSSLFGFVDDIEFLYAQKMKKLHYRSSSRVGKSDLGANKKRIDSILTSLKL